MKQFWNGLPHKLGKLKGSTKTIIEFPTIFLSDISYCHMLGLLYEKLDSGYFKYIKYVPRFVMREVSL